MEDATRRGDERRSGTSHECAPADHVMNLLVKAKIAACLLLSPRRSMKPSLPLWITYLCW